MKKHHLSNGPLLQRMRCIGYPLVQDNSKRKKSNPIMPVDKEIINKNLSHGSKAAHLSPPNPLSFASLSKIPIGIRLTIW
jgi:hypothetical protein